MTREAVLETATMKIGEDRILIVTINAGAVISLEQAKLIYDMIYRLAAGKAYGLIIDARQPHKVTREAQQYGATQTKGRTGTAIISGNIFARIGTDIFIRLFKPHSTYRVFAEIKEATDWLKEIGERAVSEQNSSAV